MLDLLALAKPLEPVKLRNGRICTVRPLDAAGWEMLREVERTQDVQLALDLLRYILPETPESDLTTIADDDVQPLFLYAAGKINAALDVVGNSSGTAAANTSPPSSPDPTPSTS